MIMTLAVKDINRRTTWENSVLNRIETHDFCHTGAEPKPIDLSSQLGAGYLRICNELLDGETNNSDYMKKSYTWTVDEMHKRWWCPS